MGIDLSAGIGFTEESGTYVYHSIYDNIITTLLWKI